MATKVSAVVHPLGTPAASDGVLLDVPPAARRRDATRTRKLLLEAARNRFATNGYDATTVREISEDAGVNVALINRYFQSKEGLFRACMTGAVDEFNGTVPANTSLGELASTIAGHLAGPHSTEHPHVLLLLLRSSQDEQAEKVRVDVMRSFAHRLALAAGWRPDAPDGDRLMLNAQIVLSAVLGIALLRAKGTLEPLTTASADDLAGPLDDLVTALLAEP